jgi:membrane AbrB-like protein
MRTTVGWMVLGVGSLLAGLFAQSAGLPAGWLVGPMLVALALALVWKEHPTVPRWGRIASLAVVGGMLAATFRPSVIPLVAGHWLPVTLVVCGTLFLSLGAGLLLSGLVRIDRKTAALGALPGAASGMLAMSDPLGRCAPGRLDAVYARGRGRRDGYVGRPARSWGCTAADL